MSNSILSKPFFHNEEAAYEFVEARIWPNGALCPHCGGTERNKKMGGASTRIGTYKCYDCRKPFTVKIGTIFEASHIPMRLWLQAIFLIASSKKGISSNQLHRTLGITLKSAWFMSHRIREAMKANPTGLLGEGGGTVEADETYIGNGPRSVAGKAARAAGVQYGGDHKEKVVAVVERDGQVRSFHVRNVDGKTLKGVLVNNVAKEAKLMTDELRMYRSIGKNFASHEAVKHTEKEYVRGNAHTNTIEGVFSIFKRGMKGVYQHCEYQHLRRYLSEFDFRYNNRKALGVEDAERADNIVSGAVGKRLMYKTSCYSNTLA
jgi:transposase-like protein